jgi:hypothetical protein
LQYSSQKLVDLLDSEPESSFHGHGTSIFLSSADQAKRVGVQTWMDYPVTPQKNKNECVQKDDIELMRHKMKASLTLPIAGK